VKFSPVKYFRLAWYLLGDSLARYLLLPAILAVWRRRLPFWQSPCGVVIVILLCSYINFTTITIIIDSNKPMSPATIFGPHTINDTIQLNIVSTNITTDANPPTILHLLAKPMIIVNRDSSFERHHITNPLQCKRDRTIRYNLQQM
jgi:hypothetical protein